MHDLSEIRTQNLETARALAAGVAHKFNNRLMVIIFQSSWLLEQLSDEAAKQSLGEIKSAAREAADLSRKLNAFSRSQPVTPRAVSVNDLIRGMEPLLRSILDKGVRLDLVLGQEPGGVGPDLAGIEQILIHMAVQANAAMPGGGVLAIETGEEPETADGGAVVRFRHTSDSGSDYPAAPTDTGQTPDPVGSGGRSGRFDVSVVGALVERLGGGVEIVESGEGTTVSVKLPAYADPSKIAIQP